MVLKTERISSGRTLLARNFIIPWAELQQLSLAGANGVQQPSQADEDYDNTLGNFWEFMI